MRFESPWFFILLLLIPALHRWWRQRNLPARVRYSLPIPEGAAASKGAEPMRWLLWLRYLGLVFLVAALARPQNSYKQNERIVSGVDIMMVMDVSASMNIEDLEERPRFDVAKDTMERFIKGRQNDRIGFVIFSGEPFTAAPLTLDYSLVLKALREARSGILKDGTGIGDGLALAVSRLKDSKAKSRVIVLLTDGDNNVGQVDPATAGELAAGYGIRVYTIAIGREGRVKMPIRRTGVFGNTITTYQYFDNALNPELLEHIAKSTSGKFFRVTEDGALDGVFQEINRLEKSEVKSNEKVRYEENFQRPLKIGLLLLLIEQILALGWWRFMI